MIPLLVLRPEPGASATVARAKALGLAALAVPLFTIEPLAWAPPPADGFDALMITSANAARQAGPALATYRALPTYAVGAATADALREAGFSAICVGQGDAAALVAHMAKDGIASALHLGGEIVRTVARPGVTIDHVAVYRAAAVETLPALPVPAVALIHSPRAAHIFAALVDQVGLDRAAIAIAAISEAAATAAGPGWRTIAFAPHPTDDALLALAARLCEG